MDWSNESVLEFLKLFQTEPCLWDSRLKSYNKRAPQSDAWYRIVQGLSFRTTVEEAKKKKDSLMGYYRIHLNRYKKSFKAGTGSSGTYTTSWFAFDVMNQFLKPVYDGNKTLSTESSSYTSGVDGGDDNTMETEGSVEDVLERVEAVYSDNISPLEATTSDPLHSSAPRKRQYSEKCRYTTKRMSPEFIEAKTQLDEAYNSPKTMLQRNQTQQMDEYDHFGLMISAKIRKIRNSVEREILMNSIQNLVFKSYLKNNCGIISQYLDTENSLMESVTPQEVPKHEATQNFGEHIVKKHKK